MLPLARVGDALLAHSLDCIQLRRACQFIPRNFPVEPQVHFWEVRSGLTPETGPLGLSIRTYRLLSLEVKTLEDCLSQIA